jgi:hypothetical protein
MMNQISWHIILGSTQVVQAGTTTLCFRTLRYNLGAMRVIVAGAGRAVAPVGGVAVSRFPA